MSVWRQTGRKPKELDEMLTLPSSCREVWRIFLDLHNSRTSNGFGVNPVSFSDIYAYSKLMNIELEEWEINLIRKFDSTVIGVYSDHQAKETRKNQSKK